jgi:hypothetical protein
MQILSLYLVRLISDNMRAAKKIISAILLCTCQTASLFLFAQSDSYREGKVYNSETSEPVPFAEIRLKKNELSVYTNEDGTFRLIHDSDFQSDSLLVTRIGYKKHSIAFSDLNSEEVNKIYLAPSKYGEEKVKIAARDAKLNSAAIIRIAIGNLNSRYPVKPFSYISYYRDYQKKDSNYINLNEAIVQTTDSGFNSGFGSNIYRLTDFRKNMNFPRMDFFRSSLVFDSIDFRFPERLIPNNIRRDQYGTELFTIMAHDPVRNFMSRSFSFVEIFSKNFVDNHNFSPPSEISNDNLLLYKITFNCRTTVIGDSMMVSGAIYIQPKKYSIHKLEYSCYKLNKGKEIKKVFDFEVEYGNDNTPDSLMRLKYISLCRLFNVIDANDNSFFRLTSSRWDLYSNINPTLALTFNNKVDPVTASNKENFTIIVDGKEIKINAIQVAGENIFIRFKNEVLKDLIDSCEVYTGVLKDINGNILDQRKSLETYQYRELFVQEYNKPVIHQDSSTLQHSAPVKDTIPALGRKEKYWMNTPKIR